MFRKTIDLNVIFKLKARKRLEQVVSYTEKSYIASYYKQLSTETKRKNHKIKTSFVQTLEANKTGFKTFLFQYPRKAVYNTMR